MRFSEMLWRSISDVYSAILTHPFITGLTDGSLPIDTFKSYVIQDAIYLSRFARAVAVVGAKAPDDASALKLISAASDALSTERAMLHDFLLSEWGVKASTLSENDMSPVNRAYTDFLIASAYERSFLVGLSSILPCFWLYMEVGKELLKRGSRELTYQRWIDTYSSPGYAQAVKGIVEVADVAVDGAGRAEIGAAAYHFRLSAIYEYLFWDSAYKGGGWSLKPNDDRFLGPIIGRGAPPEPRE